MRCWTISTASGPSVEASLDQIFQAHIQTLALTLRRDAVTNYRCLAQRFLCYLHAAFPQLRRLSQLRRNPHLLGWFRRLLENLTAHGHSIQPDLIRREDFPPRPQYLPRPLSPGDDRLVQQELRRTDGLPANALLLTRATGIRIGECIDLSLDCLRQVGPEPWALQFLLANCTPKVWRRPMKMDDEW